MTRTTFPERQGLYDPRFEHGACGLGFVVDIKGRRSHEIVRNGLQVLLNLEHRGASGCEKNTGDGAGVLIQIPHQFLARECEKLGITIPAPDGYGVGMVFLPREEEGARQCEEAFEAIAREEGQRAFGWRTVPV